MTNKTAAHIVLDLEALSTKPNAAVCSIGAAALAADGTLLGSFHVAVSEAGQDKRHVDDETVRWWFEQSEAARAASVEALDAVPATQAMCQFSAWVQQMTGCDTDRVQMWGNGSSFDCVILRTLYEECHDLGHPAPWHWRNDRDMRTVLQLYPAAKHVGEFVGTKHHAEHDALHEAKQLARALQLHRLSTAVCLPADRAQRVYVSGPMTGLPGLNFAAFNAAAQQLRAQGWDVENPADHGEVAGAEWADYLHADMARLATCGAIYLLPGWSRSKGARLEVQTAQALGMRVVYGEGAEEVVVGEIDRTAPERIRLWIDLLGDPADRSGDFKECAEVCWAAESSGGIEIEYVRADLAALPVDSLHQHLLNMLGAKDHADAERIIADLHATKFAQPAAQGVDENQDAPVFTVHSPGPEAVADIFYKFSSLPEPQGAAIGQDAAEMLQFAKVICRRLGEYFGIDPSEVTFAMHAVRELVRKDRGDWIVKRKIAAGEQLPEGVADVVPRMLSLAKNSVLDILRAAAEIQREQEQKQ